MEITPVMLDCIISIRHLKNLMSENQLEWLRTHSTPNPGIDNYIRKYHAQEYGIIASTIQWMIAEETPEGYIILNPIKSRDEELMLLSKLENMIEKRQGEKSC